MAAKTKSTEQTETAGMGDRYKLPPQPQSAVMLALAEIHDDGHNHRIAGGAGLKKAEEAKVASLAATMKLDGQLQPIKVYRDVGGRYVRIFGSRRCAAAKLLGWAMIRAEVRPSIPTPAELQRMRATENLERADLSPAEQALAVWECVQATGQLQAGGMEAAEKIVAANRGRPVSWVKDCLYVVNRLTPKVRELLAAGLLNLGQARVLATCGGELQEGFGAQAALEAEDALDVAKGYTAGGRIVSPEEIAGWIANAQKSLKVVAWELDKPMDTRVKGCNVCLGCAHNTATDLTLFGLGQPDKDGAGFCRLPEGFAAKRVLVQKDIDKAIDKTKKQVKEKKVDKEEAAAAGSVREALPAYVKTASAQRQVKKALGLNPEKPTQTENARNGQVQKKKLSPELEALAKWGEAYDDWSQGVENQLNAYVAKDPYRRVASLLLLAGSVGWPEFLVPSRYSVEQGLAKKPPAEGALSAGAAKLLAAAGKMASGSCTTLLLGEIGDALAWPVEEAYELSDGFELRRSGPELIKRICDTFGLALKTPAPVLADFLPNPAAAAEGKFGKSGKTEKGSKKSGAGGGGG